MTVHKAGQWTYDNISFSSHVQTFAGENYISGSWQKCENMNLDYSNVALIHSYVKNSPSLVMVNISGVHSVISSSPIANMIPVHSHKGFWQKFILSFKNP